MSQEETKAEKPGTETQGCSEVSESRSAGGEPINIELNVTSAEQSDSESSAEEHTDREREFKSPAEEFKQDKSYSPDSKPTTCKRASPKSDAAVICNSKIERSPDQELYSNLTESLQCEKRPFAPSSLHPLNNPLSYRK
eukprot:g44005.t1